MGGGNVRPALEAGAGEEEVLGTAVAAVVDSDGAAVDEGASLGWSRRDHEGKRDLLAGEWVPE